MSEAPVLDGPALPPASGGEPRHLVILLHGVGADGYDLIALAPSFREAVPEALFVSPHAPDEFDLAPSGRQWFSLMDLEPDTRIKGARAAAPVLEAFIGGLMERFELAEANVALVGFSQGATMALHVGLRWPRPFAGIISFSGIMAGPEVLADEVRSRPPVLLTHGTHDQVLPIHHLDQAVEALAAAGIEHASHRRPRLEHGIDQECVRLGRAFLKKTLASK